MVKDPISTKITLTGKWVFDSHLLVYVLDNKSPFFKAAERLFSLVLDGAIQGVIAQQNILEAEKVLISAYHQKPLSVIKLIDDIIYNFKFTVISPLPSTINHIHELIKNTHKPFDIFDLYLSATMLDNGIGRILTLNTKDFAGIKGITAMNPFS